jgi:hypothetical protein
MMLLAGATFSLPCPLGCRLTFHGMPDHVQLKACKLFQPFGLDIIIFGLGYSEISTRCQSVLGLIF